MNRFLIATVLVTGAIATTPATASTDCNPYPSCCIFEENPWQCIAGGAVETVDNAEVQFVDPLVCPIFASLGGNYGPVTIYSDGDIYVTPDALGTNPVFDCPPYGFG